MLRTGTAEWSSARVNKLTRSLKHFQRLDVKSKGLFGGRAAGARGSIAVSVSTKNSTPLNSTQQSPSYVLYGDYCRVLLSQVSVSTKNSSTGLSAGDIEGLQVKLTFLSSKRTFLSSKVRYQQPDNAHHTKHRRDYCRGLLLDCRCPSLCEIPKCDTNSPTMITVRLVW
jgi:hypothetical protein